MIFLSALLSQNPQALSGKRALVRVDFNVPIENGAVRDTYRIERTLPTIEALRKAGASVVLMSHIESDRATLAPVAEFLSQKFPTGLITDFFPATDKLPEPSDEVLILENLRRYEEEKDNNADFAYVISRLADVYINDAFSASHRTHASIVGVPHHLPSYAGFLFEEEFSHLFHVLHPHEPLFFIIGGAKFETKMPLLKKFYEKAATTFVGGALANDFFHAKGYEVGQSLLSQVPRDLSQFSGPHLILPIDVVAVEGEKQRVCRPNEVLPNETIVDIGPQSIELVKETIKEARTIVWNGPMGNYEKGFSKSSTDIAEAIASSSADSVIGGGDTIATVRSLGLKNPKLFLSTAGGAMLDFLINETLPGIEALK